MSQASGIDPSSLEADGLADTPVSSDEQPDDDVQSPPDPDEDDDDTEAQHLCLECGDPVERRGKTGPWPTTHPGCK